MDNIAQVFTLHREIRLWRIAGPNDPAFGHLGAEEKVYRFAQFLMVQTAALDATDPRDKVFALATFIKSYATYLGARADWFKPDYTVQPTEAMLVAVQLVMHKTRSVDLLSYVADPSSRAPSNLPTWFPHFHLPRAVASVDSLLRIFQGRLFHAGSYDSRPDAVRRLYPFRHFGDRDYRFRRRRTSALWKRHRSVSENVSAIAAKIVKR